MSPVISELGEAYREPEQTAGGVSVDCDEPSTSPAPDDAATVLCEKVRKLVAEAAITADKRATLLEVIRDVARARAALEAAEQRAHVAMEQMNEDAAEIERLAEELAAEIRAVPEAPRASLLS